MDTPTKPQTEQWLQQIIGLLEQPLTATDRQQGWDEEVQAAMLAGLGRLQVRLEAATTSVAQVKGSSLLRSLDAWGVSASDKSEKIIVLWNKFTQSG